VPICILVSRTVRWSSLQCLALWWWETVSVIYRRLLNASNSVGNEILTALTVKSVAFWDVTIFILVNVYCYSEETLNHKKSGLFTSNPVYIHFVVHMYLFPRAIYVTRVRSFFLSAYYRIIQDFMQRIFLLVNRVEHREVYQGKSKGKIVSGLT
jgi:hypothetical protein